MRGWMGKCYRLLDNALLSRFPDAWRRTFAIGALRLAKGLFPRRPWATSPDVLLVRRSLRQPPKHLRELPDWARHDMASLARQVDSMLTPESFSSLAPPSFTSAIHWHEAGHAYHRLRNQVMGLKFDTIILVPCLKRGGADLGAIHHVHACHEAFSHRVLVIATEACDSPWASRLPKGVEFLDAGNELSALDVANREPELVLSRLLIQLAPARIHIINSDLAWRVVARFGKAIRQSSRIYASLYCDELDPEGRPEGLAQRHLPNAYHWLDAVISDNTVSPRTWVRSLGIDPNLFHVVHFPRPAVDVPVLEAAPSRRLLWASRLVRQKRPDLLMELIKATPEFHWDVHGSEPGQGKRSFTKALRRLGNVTVHGGYDDFSQIVRNDHLAFVYTTAWDGLPNVLLETASARLPLVAPDVGGIRDLVPASQLLPATAGTEAYVDLIWKMTDAAIRQNYLAAQEQRLKAFTLEEFVASLKMLPNYA